MIYLVVGNSEERKTFINTTIEKLGGDSSRAVRVSSDDLSEEKTISDIVITQSGLFGDKEFFVITDMSRELPLSSLLEEYQSSNNVIFFSEASITKKIHSSFEKVSAEIQEFSVEKKEETNSFNIFSLTDAFGRRDKKNLWLGYTQALQHSSVEEINGVLLWQIKNMILVATTSGTSVEGMKPFVFKKTQGFLKNYSLQELKDIMKKLTEAFHKRDIYNTLEIQLEKIILSL